METMPCAIQPDREITAIERVLTSLDGITIRLQDQNNVLSSKLGSIFGIAPPTPDCERKEQSPNCLTDLLFMRLEILNREVERFQTSVHGLNKFV